jgi:hypothetical protein
VAAITIRGVWTTTAPPASIWAVVVDLGSWSAWWPAIQEARLLDGDTATADAAELVFDTPSPLRPLVVTLGIEERRAPDLLRVAVVDGPLRGHGTVQIVGDELGSRTSYDIELRVRSLLFKPLEPVLAGATRSSGRARLRQAGADLAALAGGELRPDGPAA